MNDKNNQSWNNFIRQIKELIHWKWRNCSFSQTLLETIEEEEEEEEESNSIQIIGNILLLILINSKHLELTWLHLFFNYTHSLLLLLKTIRNLNFDDDDDDDDDEHTTHNNLSQKFIDSYDK